MTTQPIMLQEEFATRMAVVDALRELLTEKDIDRVTVAELCEQAGISRTTFYRYFSDKYAITEWHFGHFCDRFSRGIGRGFTFVESNRRILQVFLDERLIYTESCKSQKSSSMLLYARRHLTQNLTETIESHLGMAIDPELRFQIEFASYLIVEMSGWWIVDAHGLSLDEFLEDLNATIPARLRELLDGHVVAL